MTPSRCCLAIVAFAAALSAVMPVSRTSAAAACPTVAGPTARVAWRAELAGETPVRPRLAHAATARTGPRSAGALLVLGRAREADGRCWLRVRLPSRPNTASGWIPASRVVVRETRWRIDVDPRARRVVVRRDGRVVRRLRVVVGAPATPTPRGLFAVSTVSRAPASSFYGAWIVALTAHSTQLKRYDGGDGRVALHGRGGASFLDPLGTARSHGCVRLTNRAIGWLVRAVGATRLAGTPVRIR